MSRQSELRRARLLRPRRFDEFGLRSALSDRILPALVAAMAFLAALAMAGGIGAAALASHWRTGAGAALTVQVPRPTLPDEARDGTRITRVADLLHSAPGVTRARVLPNEELNDLLRPWLGSGIERLSLPLPAVIEVHLGDEGFDLDALSRRLAEVAPGTIVESHGVWLGRLSALAESLQACAAVAVLVVGGVAAAVVAVATRAGLASRREAIEIVHGLGATDGYIASRFARRVSGLAAIGGFLGAAAAMPVLLGLASLAAPFTGMQAPTRADPGVLDSVPPTLWLALPGLSAAAAFIGFMTAHATVRRWLRRLP